MINKLAWDSDLWSLLSLPPKALRTSGKTLASLKMASSLHKSLQQDPACPVSSPHMNPSPSLATRDPLATAEATLHQSLSSSTISQHPKPRLAISNQATIEATTSPSISSSTISQHTISLHPKLKPAISNLATAKATELLIPLSIINRHPLLHPK